MKPYKYKIYFTSGLRTEGHAGSIYDAAIIAKAEAINKGLDHEIEVIKDEDGKEYCISQDLEIEEI